VAHVTPGYGSPWELILTGEPYTDHERLWREHRAELLTEWERRGGKGKPWGMRTFEGSTDGNE
jgi:hypothetical protein